MGGVRSSLSSVKSEGVKKKIRAAFFCLLHHRMARLRLNAKTEKTLR